MHGLVGADLVGRAFDDHAAVVHHRHALGDAQRDVHVVLDQDQRDRRVELQEQLRERDALAAREPRGGLVEHHQRRVDGARHADLELALLAVRERADERLLAALEPDGAREARARARAARRRGRSTTGRRCPVFTPSTAR